MKPIISVIVPVYNSEQYLKKCLDSITKQSFDDYEIILINDGSTDDSLKVINEYKLKSNKIKSYSYKKNKGVSYARNYGVFKAIGKYIAFVDSDDYIEKNMLRDMFEIAENEKADIVCSKQQNFIYEDREELINLYILGDTILKNYILLTPGPTNKLFSKDVLLKDKFPIGINYEDLAVMPSLILFTDRISFIDKCYYNYVQRLDSITNQRENISKREDIYKAVDILYEKFKKKKVISTYYQELEYIYIKQVLLEMSKYYLTIDITTAELKNKIKLLKDFIKNKFPNWPDNIYYNNSKLKYKSLGWLINNNYFIALIFWKKKYLLGGMSDVIF